jgi:hypothetical protein
MPLARCTHSWCESLGMIDRRSRREYRNSQESLPVATYCTYQRTQRLCTNLSPIVRMQAATQVAQPSFLHLASQNRHMTAAQFPHHQKYFELYCRLQRGAGAERKDYVRKYM